MQTIKCVLVGDGAVGKTRLIISYTSNTSTSEYVPPLQDSAVTVVVGGEPYALGLYDTSKQEECDPRLRFLGYTQTNVFLICFSIASPLSFENIKEKWVPEIKYHCPNTPFLLVGTQVDLRDDVLTLEKLAKNKRKPINSDEAGCLARELGAVKYMECSAATMKGVKEVFAGATLAALEPPKPVKKKKCIIS